MGGKILALALTVLILHGIESQSPPKIAGSFIGWGEIVQQIADNFTLQINFEESYDASTKNSAFFLWFGGKNLTFVKYQNPDQTFLYLETDKKEIECLKSNETEYAKSEFETILMAFNDDEGRFQFSLLQLFGLSEKYLTQDGRGVSTVYRGFPAKSWTYQHASNEKNFNLTVTSYWSDGSMDTSAGRTVSPLGFKLTKVNGSGVVETYIISVFGFVPDAYDHKYFQAIEGVVCPDRKQTLKFPNVNELKAISLHTELALPDYQELRYFDTWLDPVNQLLRFDVERIKDEDPMERKFKKYQSEISIGKLGVVFRYGYFKGESSCEVMSFDNYESDLQNLFDVKQGKWMIGKLFGLNDTLYTYIGKTTKYDIPCHVFQGIRTDWPDKAAGIKSLWEWCFNVNMSNVNDIVMFKDDEFGLISAQVKILSAKDTMYNKFRMNYHFYEVKAQNPKILSSTSFDIGRCFSDLQKRALQFSLKISLDEDSKLLAENATSDVDFLQKWKSALYIHTKLQDYSLRISDLRSTIDGEKIYIKFNILDVHKDLPDDKKKNMITSDEAEKNLRNNIDSGKVMVSHEWKKGTTVTLEAQKGTLEYQLDPKFDPVTVSPITIPTTSESTLNPFTLLTDEPLKRIQRYTGNRSGTVAGVSIAMVLVGISLGAGATFFKFNGLPAFCRR